LTAKYIESYKNFSISVNDENCIRVTLTDINLRLSDIFKELDDNNGLLISSVSVCHVDVLEVMIFDDWNVTVNLKCVQVDLKLGEPPAAVHGNTHSDQHHSIINKSHDDGQHLQLDDELINDDNNNNNNNDDDMVEEEGSWIMRWLHEALSNIQINVENFSLRLFSTNGGDVCIIGLSINRTKYGPLIHRRYASNTGNGKSAAGGKVLTIHGLSVFYYTANKGDECSADHHDADNNSKNLLGNNHNSYYIVCLRFFFII